MSKNKDILAKLGKVKLKTPKGLRKFIFNNTDYKVAKTKKARYVNVIEMYENRLLLRTFAFANVNGSHRYRDIQYMEVCRRLQGEKDVILHNIEHSLAGHRVFFDDDFTYRASSKSWYFDGYNFYDEQEMIDNLNIKYCQWFKYKKDMELYWPWATIPFFEYICRYIEEPKIELLVKAGLPQYVSCVKKLNLKEKSIKKIFNVSEYWVEYLQMLQYRELLIIRKRKDIKTTDDLHYYQEFPVPYGMKKDALTLKQMKYIEKKAIENKKSIIQMCITYRDYLRFCKILEIDMNNSINVFPRNLKERHDEYQKSAKLVEKEISRKKFFKAYVENLKFVYSKDKLVILPVEDQVELKQEGKQLNHCVATYADRYVERETNILLIRKLEDIETPFVTLEFQKKRVIQCRAKNNARPGDDVIDFINDWCSKYHLKSCFPATTN